MSCVSEKYSYIILSLPLYVKSLNKLDWSRNTKCGISSPCYIRVSGQYNQTNNLILSISTSFDISISQISYCLIAISSFTEDTKWCKKFIQILIYMHNRYTIFEYLSCSMNNCVTLMGFVADQKTQRRKAII